MSPAEENAVRTSARNGWLLPGAALIVLASVFIYWVEGRNRPTGTLATA